MAEQHSWHDDTPATDEQIDTIRRDLDGGPGVGGAAFSRHAVRKLLAAYDEIHLDRAVLKATNTALETRAKKAEAELTDAREANAMLRDRSKKLRAELDKCAGLNRSLVNEAADAETALAELRERIGREDVEWSVRWHEDGAVSEKRHTEAEARERGAANPRTMAAVRRLVGEWKAAGDG